MYSSNAARCALDSLRKRENGDEVSRFGRYAFGFCAAAMLGGCAGGSGGPLSPSPGAPATALGAITAERPHGQPAYSVLYRFKGSPGDGYIPTAGLLNVKGTLYGTTFLGGANNDGIVFSITTSGAETVLYSFKGGLVDGENPEAALLNVKGTLYSTTQQGGANSGGTVFKITTSGAETVLYSFKGGSADGETPVSALLNVKGTLYGTTSKGGADNDGTVFKITTSGAETLLYSFRGGSDGANPDASLINVKGTLYGTTQNGGSHGEGTLFSITTSGAETVLYNFKGGSGDGEDPYAGLLNVKGTIYGTTYQGGVSNDGTVFKMTTSGAETVLYSFKGGGDGQYPYAPLLSVKGRLYGTTGQGGGSYRGGTVFALTTSGKETVLHSFGPGTGDDGENPYAGLLNVNGTLYGTTEDGGLSNQGTVFSLSP
jgi:uncharacterized repeat protein (TIGR03803 family)